ncbi:MAG: hypothetical protein MdMp014T_2905 [Treponematales bacterium]
MVPKRVLSAAAGALALAALLAGCPAEGDDDGGFIMAWKEENICFVAPWSGAEVDYGDATKEYFYYLFDEERVLDFTRWDQEAQRLYSWHIIVPLEYEMTGGNYLAVRRFTDTGEIYTEPEP